MFSDYNDQLTDKRQEKLAQEYYNSEFSKKLPKWQLKGLSVEAIEEKKRDLLLINRVSVHKNYQKMLGIDQITRMLSKRFGEHFTPLISKIDFVFVTNEELVNLKIEVQKLLGGSQNIERIEALFSPIIGRPVQMRKQLEEAQSRLDEAQLRLNKEIELRETAEQRALEESRLRQENLRILKEQDTEIAKLKKLLSEPFIKSIESPQINGCVPLIFSENHSQKRERSAGKQQKGTEKVDDTLTEIIETSNSLVSQAKKLKGGTC